MMGRLAQTINARLVVPCTGLKSIQYGSQFFIVGTQNDFLYWTKEREDLVMLGVANDVMPLTTLLANSIRRSQRMQRMH